MSAWKGRRVLVTGATGGVGSVAVAILAEWGYNTSGDRSLARQTPAFHSLSLDQFAGPFSGWLPFPNP